MDEDLDALAEKEIALADIRAESTTKQIELNNKINSIEAETEMKRKEAFDKRMERIKEEKEAKEKAAEEAADAEVQRADGWEKRVLKQQAIIDAVEDYKKKTIHSAGYYRSSCCNFSW